MVTRENPALSAVKRCAAKSSVAGAALIVQVVKGSDKSVGLAFQSKIACNASGSAAVLGQQNLDSPYCLANEKNE